MTMHLSHHWSKSKVKVTGAATTTFALVVIAPFVLPPIINMWGPGVSILYGLLGISVAVVAVMELSYRDRISGLIYEHYKSGLLGFLPTTEDSVRIYTTARKNNLSVFEYLQSMQEAELNCTPISRDFLYHGF